MWIPGNSLLQNRFLPAPAPGLNDLPHLLSACPGSLFRLPRPRQVHQQEHAADRGQQRQLKGVHDDGFTMVVGLIKQK